MKTSMCGMTLKAICLEKVFGRDLLAGDVDALGLVPELVHRLLARARDRLVGRDDDPLDPRAVVQRLQRHHHLRGRAVGVGDDVLGGVALDRVRVHLRHDQRHLGVVAVERRVVDHDAAGLGGDRRVLLRRVRTDGEERDVPAGEVEAVEVERLQGLARRTSTRCRGSFARRARRSRRRETPARRGCSAFRGPRCPWRRRRRPDSPFFPPRN